MSKKSSPQSGPTRRPRERSQTRVNRPRVQLKAQAPKVAQAPTNQRERIRHYLPVVLVPNLIIVMAIVVFAFAGILFSDGNFSALPSAIAEAWLSVHLVPVTFQWVTLGILPLLPAMAVVWFIARRVHRAVKDRVSVLDLYTLFGLTLVIPLTLSGIAWFMVWDAAQVFPLEPPSVWLTVLHPLIVHVAGLVIGMGPTLWKLLARRSSIPESVVQGSQMATTALGRLLAAGLVVYLVLLAFGYPRITELLDEYPILSAWGAIGVILVCLLYLPNAAIGTLATLLGGEVNFGEAHISLFSIDLVPLPAFPLFAAVPGQVAVWAPALMLIPLAVLIHFVANRSWNLELTLSTTIFGGLWALLLAYLTSGELGGYGYSGPTAWLMGLVALGWFAVTIAAAWAIAVLRRRKAAPAVVAETAEGSDDVDEVDGTVEVDDEDQEPELVVAEEESAAEGSEIEDIVIDAEDLDDDIQGDIQEDIQNDVQDSDDSEEEPAEDSDEEDEEDEGPETK